MAKKKVCIIGATGSVGTQAADVIWRNMDRFDVRFVTAHNNADRLDNIAAQINADEKILTNCGMDGLIAAIDRTELDLALIAASGTDIIPIAHKLASRGVTLALANKECIVSAGKFIIDAANQSEGRIIPVDSEHSALFQCMCGQRREDIEMLTLTASGGAFRDLSKGQLGNVSVNDALKHPNWSMGQKITIDSATMMNKGLELIEARWLFNMPADKLAVVIHPQSIIHSMVSYKDGSVLAQMGAPDMRIPISYALGFPERLESGVQPLDFTRPMDFSFYPPDLDKYRCLAIALEVLKNDSLAQMAAMNAANEIAVAAFLEGKIGFTAIAALIEEVLASVNFSEPKSVADVLEIDRQSKILANSLYGVV